jgi:hypothetical protein
LSSRRRNFTCFDQLFQTAQIIFDLYLRLFTQNPRELHANFTRWRYIAQFDANDRAAP